MNGAISGQMSLNYRIFKLSIPIVLANMLHSAYQLTDTFWVGRIGADAVAAVSVSFPIIFVLLSMGMGLTVAGTVLISQYWGKNDQQMIDFFTGQTFFVMAVISIIFSFLGYYFSAYIIELMGVDQKVAKDAIDYMQISFMGLFFMYSYITFQNILRGVGNVKTPFYIVLMTVLLNFIFDPVLIMGFGPIEAMGVKGAAWATVLTQAIASLIGFILLFRSNQGIGLKVKNLVPHIKHVKKILRLGAPASAEQSARALSMTLMTFLVAHFGTHSTAVFGIGIRILSFVIIPALGFSQATSTLVGQSIGAEDREGANNVAKRATLLIFLFLTLAGVLFFFGAKMTVEIFLPNAPDVILEGEKFIKIIALTFGFIGVQQVISGAFRGGGSTTLAMLLAVISLWVIRFPLAYILAYHTKLMVDGIWWAISISNLMAGILALLIFKNANWIRNLVEEEKIENKVIDEVMSDEL